MRTETAIRWRCYSPHTNRVFADGFVTKEEAWDHACRVVPRGEHFLVGDYLIDEGVVPDGYVPDTTIDRLLAEDGDV